MRFTSQFAALSDVNASPADPFFARPNHQSPPAETPEVWSKRVRGFIWLFALAGSWALFFLLAQWILALIS